MLLGLEGLHFEHISLINGAMVELDIVVENFRNRGFFENRLPGAFGFAGAAVDAFIGMNIEHVGEIIVVVTDVFVNAIDRADADTSRIDAINAEPGYRPWHKSKSSLYVAPFLCLPRPLSCGDEKGCCEP
jgi:hypothetical protein